MLALLFLLDGERYALPCERVEAVVPRVRLRALPRAPATVAGLLNYRGALVHVVDLAQLVLHRPCTERLNTRIILTRLRLKPDHERLVGLLAERVLDALPCESEAPAPATGQTPSAPFLGAQIKTGDGPARLVVLDKLLPEDVSALLCEAPLPAGETP